MRKSTKSAGERARLEGKQYGRESGVGWLVVGRLGSMYVCVCFCACTRAQAGMGS